MKQGKSWGHTTQVLKTPFCEMHAIQIAPWMRCSKHKHLHKYNLFYVITGELLIKVYKDNLVVDETLLQAGQWTTVKPNEYHEFQTRSMSCEAIEVYYPESISEDIFRLDQGGPIIKPSDRFKEMLITPGTITTAEPDHDE